MEDNLEENEVIKFENDIKKYFYDKVKEGGFHTFITPGFALISLLLEFANEKN